MTRDPVEALALLVYTLAYLLIAFVWRSLLVWRRTGVNPYVLRADDSAHGYVGRAMRVLLLTVLALVLGLNLVPGLETWLGPVPALLDPRLAFLGWVLLLASLGWIAAAQAGMGVSWRIGVDEGARTALVQQGLFAYSRNPIFLGMRVNLLGLFLVVPNAVTLAVLVAGEVVMGVQVRLEEAYLSRVHGNAYEGYRRRVRRWL
ncbi:methyltransferase family protein [Deinococcus aestuarii]|uniref:methyltransferase family protein n=1 Tax=Deinococcus aestuarii TaxID=2774531 RepID=UPI001C0E7C74|nr:isoprenylcysteine carboxylmethyltransferase family protein [Deinococcus aestuarii]